MTETDLVDRIVEQLGTECSIYTDRLPVHDEKYKGVLQIYLMAVIAKRLGEIAEGRVKSL